MPQKPDMKKVTCIVFLFLCFFLSHAQQKNTGICNSASGQFIEGPAPNIYDSLYQLSLPELTLPDHLKSYTLPSKVDNSKLPGLRPVFTQVGASCGQASAIGYNFTYEMDQARGLSADTSVNQYPTHFTYNFENSGYEYFGVSYLHSFEILRKCGCMNVRDYGGLTDGGGRWITGYDLYFNGMHNRIEDVYTIKTNTSKGILTLKNWVYNHMGESFAGGVASFYAGYSVTHLPPGTPEEGRYVSVYFTAPAVHAMTIVGYNDSIRYDYNLDGKYTNNLDINSDGIIDVRDWEIGGFKYVNSYGLNDLDSGFSYMMYKTLAEDYDHGGIWNNAVHIVKAKPDYSPLLTMKIRLKHDRRTSLHVKTGVSTDPNSLLPEYEMDFPILNFQGGNFPMQGPGVSDTMSTIELGLDITPLLGFVPENKEAAFFLSVDENDPFSLEGGSIEYMSVIDYSKSIPQMSECIQTPVEIINNSCTYVKVNALTSHNKVKINEEVFPPFQAGQPYSFQLNATGGQPPYTWKLKHNYTMLTGNKPTTFFDGTRLLPLHVSDSVMPVALGFDFPFYGQTFDTAYVNLHNGFIQFTKDNIPWPYLSETDLLLQSYRLIAPLANIGYNSTLTDEGAWYETGPGTVKIRWMLRKKKGAVYYPYEFQATLAEDGTITFNYAKIPILPTDQFFSGISDGDKKNFILSDYHSEYDANQFNQVVYAPPAYPNDLKISPDGLVECQPESAQQVYSVDCMVSDYRNITDTKTFQLTSGIMAQLLIHAGSDSIIACGEEVRADLVLTNLTNSSISNLASTLRIEDAFIVLTDSLETISNLEANSIKVVHDAFRFTVLPDATDGHMLLMNISMSSNLLSWKNSFPARVRSHLLKSIELKTTKTGNELLLPGEIGGLRYTLNNLGHIAADNVNVSVLIDDPTIKLLSPVTQSLGSVLPGQISVVDFQVKVWDSISLGTKIPVVLSVTTAGHPELSDTLYFRVGRLPAMVIDLDKNHESSPAIYQQILDLGYNADYALFIDPKINQYQSVFLSLGKFSDRYILDYAESNILANYLDHGGNLYLESQSFWRDDPLTSLQPRFSVQTKNKAHKYDSINSSAGAFTYGLNFLNIGYPMSMYYLQPLWSAFPLFENETYTCNIANDAGNYKTIGSIFNFTELKGIDDTSTLANLMKRYLDFFSVKRNSIGMEEQFVNQQKSVDVYPNPATDQVFISFAVHDKTTSKVSIHDINGTSIVELKINFDMYNGLQRVEWNLRNSSGQRVAPGLYFCRIISAKEVRVGKILVL